MDLPSPARDALATSRNGDLGAILRTEFSQVIERPPPAVFRFVVTDHVANHPRWDPDMSLEQVTPGPLGVGTVIRRSYVRQGTHVEGEMEVVEYDPDHAATMVIRDGPSELRSRISVELQPEGSTLLTLTLEVDAPAQGVDRGAVETSLGRMKELLEAEG